MSAMPSQRTERDGTTDGLDRCGLPQNRDGRRIAQSRLAGECRRHESLPLSSSVQRDIGLTPKAYATAHRSERMRAEFGRRNTVTEAIYEAGFNSNGRFYANSSEILGMKPKDYRNGGRGAAIRFAVGRCSLGSILVAASEKGVCAIFLGDDPAALTKDLTKRFPKAELIAGDRNFEDLVAKVIRFVEAPRTGWDLPLDLRGTVFQRRVWERSARDPRRHDLQLFGDRQADRRTKAQFAPLLAQLPPIAWRL